MIITTIDDCERYFSLHPKMKMLFDYVRSFDVLNAPAGRVDIDGDDVYINIDDSTMQPIHERPLEAHRRYIDVQFPITSHEVFGWSPLSSLPQQPDVPYDERRDIAFWHCGAQMYCAVAPRQCYILFPEDAHAPLVGAGSIRKVIGKLRL